MLGIYDKTLNEISISLLNVRLFLESITSHKVTVIHMKLSRIQSDVNMSTAVLVTLKNVKNFIM